MTNYEIMELFIAIQECLIEKVSVPVTKKYFLICERDTFWKSIAPTFKEKGSSSNEIMLHKVLKNNWVWENLREDYTTPALFAGIMGTIWALIW